MKPFQYARPKRLDEVLELLAQRAGEASLLAGGTDLVTSLKQGIVAPPCVISLRNVQELRGIEQSDSELRIGAGTTLADIAENRVVQQHFPSLSHAIQSIGSPQIINMATLGGNLCQRPRCWYYRQGFGLLGRWNGRPLIPDGDNRFHAIFGNQGPAYFVSPSTLAPALIALGASMEIAGPQGRLRRVPVGEFYRIPQHESEREYNLAPEEIVTAVTVPLAGLANATYKVRQRHGLDWPLVTASVAFQPGPPVRRAAVVLGHVAPKPWPVPKAAAVIEGRTITPQVAAEAGEAAAAGATPLSKNAYKVQLVKTAVKRAILMAAGMPAPLA